MKTKKFLCSISLGKNIANLNWVEDSIDHGYILGMLFAFSFVIKVKISALTNSLPCCLQVVLTITPLESDKYPIIDRKFEKKYGIKLLKSLSLARSQQVFNNMTFYISPDIYKPNALFEIIAASGGTLVLDPDVQSDKEIYYIVSKSELPTQNTNLPYRYVDAEFIYNCILRQTIK